MGGRDMVTRKAILVLARREGQLANRLFLSANLMAFARDLGVELWNPALAEYAEFFEGSRGNFLCSSLPGTVAPGRDSPSSRRGPLTRPGCRKFLASALDPAVRGLAKIRSGLFGCRAVDVKASHDSVDADFDLEDPGFLRLLEQNRVVLLRGWKFRYKRLFEVPREPLLNYFRPVREIRERAERSLADLRGGGALVVGVHIRQGDYAQWQGGRFFFPLDCYLEWMRQARALFSGREVRFLVCSNAAHPAERLRELGGVPGPGDAVADLYALADCDYLLGPPSTYTLWASFYGGPPLHMVTEAGMQLHRESFTHHGRI